MKNKLPVYKTGEFVFIDVNYSGQNVQKITDVSPWPVSGFPGQDLTFENESHCHSKAVRRLTKKEVKEHLEKLAGEIEEFEIDIDAIEEQVHELKMDRKNLKAQYGGKHAK